MKKEDKFLTIDNDLFHFNSLVMFNEFNKATSFGITQGLLDIARNGDEDINLFINSYGGVVDDLLAMIDVMNLVKNDVCTIGLGCCASCGAILLSCGKKGKRYITENARVMIHQASSLAYGKIDEMKIDVKEVDRINNLIASLLAKATGKPKKQILEDMKNDKWFTAEEAVEYGLVDKIIKSEDIKKMPIEKKHLDRNNDNEFVFNYEIKSIDSDDKYYRLKGYASTEDIDLYDEIVEQQALIKSVEKYGSPSFLHQHRHDDKPLGVIDKVELHDEKKTYIEARMPKGIQEIDDIAKLAKEGAYKGFSIGYSVLNFKYENNKRVITDIIWLETSLVTIPANRNAKLLDFKAVSPKADLPIAERDREWDSTQADKRVRKYTESDEAPSSSYRKYFMYYDSENAENFTAYKLPFADIVNGQPHIIPRAIFAIAGGRGVERANIPSEDKAKIKAKVNAIYRRMAKQFDDDSIKSPFESGKKCFDGVKSLKEVEDVLKEKGFSNQESLACIFKVKELCLKKEDTPPASDLPDDISVSDLQTYLKNALGDLQNTIDNIINK